MAQTLLIRARCTSFCNIDLTKFASEQAFCIIIA